MYSIHKHAYKLPSHSIAPTGEELELLRIAIKDEIYSTFADINKLLMSQKVLEDFAGLLLQANIIPEVIAYNPTYKDIINSFTAALPFLNTVRDIETHCEKFLGAIKTLGSAGGINCAMALKEKWKIATKTIANIDHEFLNGKTGTIEILFVLIIKIYVYRQLL